MNESEVDWVFELNTAARLSMSGLPPEILCDIFLLALPYPIHPPEYPEYRQSVLVPLRISHVCRAWRELALSFGELWSYLCIDCFGPPPIVQVFDTWLERTNGMPLNFYIIADGHWDQTPYRDAEHIITTMISEQHRWKDVEFSWTDVRLSRGFPGLNLTNLPMLESLILTADLPCNANINIARSSRLRRLVLQGMAMVIDLETGEQPLYSLTESDISFDFAHRPGSPGSDVLHRWLSFLKATPNMKKLRAYSESLSYLPLFRPRPHSESFITLPNLQVLKLETIRCDAALYILDYVTFPSLRYLRFAGGDPVENNKKGSMLVSFFERSLPPLTTLDISLLGATDDFIIPLLPLLPALKYLRIYDAAVSRRLFDLLTVKTINDTINYMDSDSGGIFEDRHMDIDVGFDIESVICPALETLCIKLLEFESDSRNPCTAFIAMVKSRAKALRRFRNIYFLDGTGRRTEVPLVTRVSLSAIDEDIGEFWRKVTRFLMGQGVVIGKYEGVDSLLVDRM